MMNYQQLLLSPLIPNQTASLVQKSAKSGVPILILGEKGTKREMIARIIHDSGEWKSHPFLKLDCRFSPEAGILDELSQLLKEVDHGRAPATLYLKEVSCLDRTNQLRLLKLLDEGPFDKDNREKRTSNLRVISSSEPMGRKVQGGEFCSDLYEWLSALLIPLPPLRARTDEIPSIAQYILSSNTEQMRLGAKRFSEEVLRLFQNYWWPGNLKEMERVIIRSAHLCEGRTIMEKDLFFEAPTEGEPFFPPPRAAGIRPLPAHGTSLVSFFIELVHRIKNPLVSVRTFTQLLRQRFDDQEFRETFSRIVSQDIDRIDEVLEGLLSYIRISIPEEKTHTIQSILEEVLRTYEARFAERKIRVIKKLELAIPETTLHDEHLRYIFRSLLEYVLPSVSSPGSIGFLTRLSPGDERSIEIVIAFDGFRKATERIEQVLGIPLQKEEPVELELRLVQEIVQRNKGAMKYEVNEEKSRTTFVLRLPAERRKVIYYPSAYR